MTSTIDNVGKSRELPKIFAICSKEWERIIHTSKIKVYQMYVEIPVVSVLGQCYEW